MTRNQTLAAVWAVLLAAGVAGVAGSQTQPTAPESPAIAASPELRWWRGNLHTHTLWSDGDDFPEMVAEWYHDNGYHFLALSDHNTIAFARRWMSIQDINTRARANAFTRYLTRFGPEWVETRTTTSGTKEVRLKPFDEFRPLVEQRGRFLMIPSEEITATTGNGKALHMNATNLIEILQPAKGKDVVEVMIGNLKAVEASAQHTGREVLVHVNHPNYKWAVTAEELAAVLDERYFEVCNGHQGDNDPGEGRRPGTEEIWDIANALRVGKLNAAPLMGLATDDSHSYHATNAVSVPGRAWVMVRSRYLTPEKIVLAMKAGEFYSTTGVVLTEVAFDKDKAKLAITIEPVEGETFTTRFVGTRRGANLAGKPRLDKDGNLIETTLDYTADGTPPIGETLATVEGLTPSYTLHGDELYVRAVVTSTGKPKVSNAEQPNKRAWTQPVGWTLTPTP